MPFFFNVTFVTTVLELVIRGVSLFIFDLVQHILCEVKIVRYKAISTSIVVGVRKCSIPD